MSTFFLYISHQYLTKTRIMRFFLLFLSLMYSVNTFAQSGCTDPIAINYDPTATVSDSSCVYSPLSLDPVSDTLCLGDTVIISWTGGAPNDLIQVSLINNTACF